MSDSIPAAQISTARAFWNTLGHPSIFMVILPSFILSARSRWGVLNFDASALGSVTFQVAGTMVALLLTASQLVSGLLVNVERIVKEVMEIDQVSLDQRKLVADQNIASLRVVLQTAWRACTFVFVSFLLSIAVMVLPERELPICQFFVLPLRSLTALLSIGFLIVGSMWFFPAANHGFDLRNVDALQQIAEDKVTIAKQKEEQERASQASGSGQTTPGPART